MQVEHDNDQGAISAPVAPALSKGRLTQIDFGRASGQNSTRNLAVGFY
jgi:hypothetical protein